jgi:hypothetical protein
MHAFLSNLTATLLAVHAVLGCCWHHGHRCAPEGGGVGSVAASHTCETHATHPGAAVDSHGDQHQGRHECRGGTCTFVGPTRENPHELPLQITAAAPGLCSDRRVVDSAARQEFCPDDAVVPPLRQHLVFSVLLI